MPKSDSSSASPVVLICGDEEFAVKQRARQLYQQWSAELGGMDHEIIDASVTNAGEALKALARLREALQTLPFFGGGKAIWFQNCNFLGEERTADVKAVNETLAEIAQEFKTFPWGNVRLLISAGKVDKRKTFYKTLDKLGTVENFAGWSIDDRNWAEQAETWAQRQLKALGKDISSEALARLIAWVGPQMRQLTGEIEKLALYVGARAKIQTADVEAIVSRNKQARAFALGEAFGDRDLPRVLKTLDDALWEVKLDSRKSEIGLLYGLISKVRTMIFLKELLRAKGLSPAADFSRFKAQLLKVPPEMLPEDKRINPLSSNPYVLFKALPQVKNYALDELVRAMDLLLECNQCLVQSSLEERMVLQQMLTEIVKPPVRPGPRAGLRRSASA